MLSKKQIRNNFRNAVFKRDKYTCRVCGFKSNPDKAEKELDAHHITDRHEMINGGYTKENGISLCSVCHEKAEEWHRSNHRNYIENYHPNDLYNLIGSSFELAVKKSEEL